VRGKGIRERARGGGPVFRTEVFLHGRTWARIIGPRGRGMFRGGGGSERAETESQENTRIKEATGGRFVVGGLERMVGGGWGGYIIRNQGQRKSTLGS